jgi:hypothetical protein
MVLDSLLESAVFNPKSDLGAVISVCGQGLDSCRMWSIPDPHHILEPTWPYYSSASYHLTLVAVEYI